ncbi:golgi apparatus membrane protein tvp15 [Anaeramoeba ignava]|uniref:Golgi apparatus membrane protein tvp15 n=1 Tax=Anaeramoeba ignava TaxID=1746090 RepID=A0A9Q0LP76_ANAIG|nr:golgi apparatus membrane protein tvp15 [Anaeramoeba ignava]|eukprot:Anaeramoba_ignava/a608005_73.p1 GENE.a608005_73~~a608005_73.p1  ORF type:complete len:175 (-),score=39.42 a608005_73:150-674(-)
MGLNSGLFKLIFNILILAFLTQLIIPAIVVMFKESNSSLNLDQFFLAFYATIFGIVCVFAVLLDRFQYFFLQFGFLRSYVGRGLFLIYASSFGIASGQNYQFFMIVGILGLIGGIATAIVGYIFFRDELKDDGFEPLRSTSIKTENKDDEKYTKIANERDNENAPLDAPDQDKF